MIHNGCVLRRPARPHVSPAGTPGLGSETAGAPGTPALAAGAPAGIAGAAGDGGGAPAGTAGPSVEEELPAADR